MSIRIVRNEQGNCINFYGSSNPTYWNACLSGQVDASKPDRINVINDIITAQTGIVEYEFYRIPYTEFTDADGNSFITPQDAADYITEKANVTGLSGDGIDLIGQTVCFNLDDTSTSIILDNGYHFGVNTIKAVPNADGTIHIISIDDSNSITHFYNLEVGNACINNEVVQGGLNDVANVLNELFSVGPFESVVISDPFSTMVANVSGVDIISPTYIGNAIDPVGVDVFGASASGSLNGYLSTEVIDQAGEYFTFDIRVEGIIGMGLVHSQASYDAGYYSGSAAYANPTTFGTSNNQHYGFQFSHWFHPTPNGPWTNYGANTSYVQGPGWSNVNKRFMSSDEGAEWLAGNPVKMRVGLDANGFISVDYYDVSESAWIVCARTSYASVEGVEYRLGIKMGDTNVRLNTLPKIHELEPAAPVMNFRYVESPDGYYSYPLFATQEEADYYELISSGSDNGSHTHVYPDDPTFTTWYMPNTSFQMNYQLTPIEDGLTTFNGNPIIWTEITTLTNADLLPPAFTDTTITVNELSSVNYQLSPQDVGYTTTIGGIPNWSIPDGYTLQGTAPEVTGDNVANPSDTTTVTVYRTNSYGTSQGTLTINIINLTAPVITAITGFTHNTSSTALLTSATMDNGSVVDIDETLLDLERLIILKTYVEDNVLPSLQQPGDKYYMGVLNSGADVSSVEDSDWDFAFVWEYQTTSTHQYRVIKDGVQQHQVGIGSSTVALFDYAIEAHDGHMHMIACNVNAINTEPSPEFGGSFTNATSVTLDESYPLTISLAYVGSDSASFSITDLSEIVTPIPDDWVQVTANPANVLNFDGSTTMPTLQAGYTYRFLMGDTQYSDLSTSTGLQSTDVLRFTSDGTTEYTTGITRVGNPDDLDTFGAHTAYVEFVVPSDVPPLQWYTDNSGIGSATSVNIAGSSYVTPVTGITLEGPGVNQTGTNLFNDPAVDADGVVWGWLSIDEQLSAGERLVMDNAFLVDLTDAMPNNSGIFIGLKSGTWTNTYRNNSIANATVGGARFAIYKYSASDIRVVGLITGGSTISKFVGLNGILNNGVELAFDITSSGNNIRLMIGSSSNSLDDVNSTAYADWDSSYKTQTGDQGYGLTSVDVMILGDANVSGTAADSAMNSADVDWTGLSEINVPTPAVSNLTSWSKALDFSGSSERAQQVTSDSNRIPMKMGGTNNQVSAPTVGQTVISGHPWATAIVFRSDKNSSNQHIWNLGEGAGTTDDNIYLRTDSTGKLYFGWGRQGDLCEMLIHPAATGTGWTLTAGNWYGIYIAHNGTRYGSNNTTSLMADAFDIRLMGSSNNWATVNGSDTNLSIASDWTINGDGRMNRQYQGDMTIGGRGANRNFHGKVASFVSTTLRVGVAMPTTAEIELMITDPIKWLDDYKVGQNFRLPWSTSNAAFNFALGDGSSSYSTQVWLMGDGTNDSYSNMIRNQVRPSDQNYTKLNLISMVSNDIENVTIPGLS